MNRRDPKLLGGVDIHNGHSAGDFHDDCTYEDAGVVNHGIVVCEKHTGLLRNKVLRKFPVHDDTTIVFEPSEFDSN